MSRPMKFLALAALILGLQSAQAQEPSPFTQAQVLAGHKDYYTYCGECHGDNLAGSGEVPPLTGDTFNGDWSNKSIHDFYAFVSTAMPQGLAGDLSPESYSNIIAYILAANGAKPGAAPFDRNSTVKLGTITDGKIVPSVIAGAP
jgi:S-disulfanyl-L-cysteine oxidoreductase SoxD